MKNIQLNNEADRENLRALFKQRIAEYQNDLSAIGLTAQQYDILRGQIHEVKDLIVVLSLHRD